MNILIIDDDIEILDALRITLEPTGHNFEFFQNPLEAVEVYKQKLHDIIITDISMPEISGIEVLKRARKINSDAYIILITGYKDLNAAIEAVNHQAYAFFDKPVDIEGLLDTIDRIDLEKKGVQNKEEERDKMISEIDKLKKTVDELNNLYNTIKKGKKF